MEKKFFEKYLNEKIAIGVKHFYENRVFFYFGTLTSLDNDFLILEFDTGVKKIPYSSVLDVHLDNRQRRHF